MKLLIILFSLLSFQLDSITITVKAINFDNNKGSAFIRVRNEKGEIIDQQKTNIKNGEANIIVKLLKIQKVAVDAFHDENGNGKMDKNMFGVPSEAWGISSDNRPSLRAPTLNEMLVPAFNGSVVIVKMD